VVSLSAANQLFLNDEPISRGQLAGRLRELSRGESQRDVTFRADRTLRYETVLDTLAAIRQAGATTVQLAYEEARNP
jgi:biopolymer transport protein ExbD